LEKRYRCKTQYEDEENNIVLKRSAHGRRSSLLSVNRDIDGVGSRRSSLLLQRRIMSLHKTSE
jgi:hypothetical protein